MDTRGVVYIHSAPPAVCPHVEWAISTVLDTRVSLSWTAQDAAPGHLRATMAWSGRAGTAGRLASALRTWHMLRYEVTEEPSAGCDGERICYIPGRGLWRAAISANGDIVVGESQLHHLMAISTGLDDLRARLQGALGADIDAELEPYRRAGEGSEVTWLYQVG